MRHPSLALLLLAAVTAARAGTQLPVVSHQLDVRIDPQSGRIEATDRLTLPPGEGPWTLLLHRGLSPRPESPGASVLPKTAPPSDSQGSDLEAWRLALAGTRAATLAYAGTIRHPLEGSAEGMGREVMATPGTISPEGVFLDGASGWYPRIPGTFQRFELRVALPDGWQAVSQGAGPGGDGGRPSWSETSPQESIALVAAPFRFYRSPSPKPGEPDAQVWLRTPDPALAERYLAATREYLDLYSAMIGPYPYAKFALVENFWETGWGLPSFTLLGPQVIRLPFILDSSYPHEILHDWWGNGVYVDDSSGNWSEGLTAYLADHLMQERKGRGADYRREALKSYGDYVRAAQDFPLSDFRARHSAASQAIGYGKAAMVFRMLEVRLGHDAFVAGLRRFYADNRFSLAGWGDLQRAFERAGGEDLSGFFDAWVLRTGAARLALGPVRVESAGTGAGAFRVLGRIEQTQDRPFPLRVPIEVALADGSAKRTLVALDGPTADFSVDLPARPVCLSVDPSFDTFRSLLPGESPVALSNLFGAERGTILLPASADKPSLEAFRALADAWTHGTPGWSTVLDRDLGQLPRDRAIWILGWENRFAHAFAEGSKAFALDPVEGALTVGGSIVSRSEASGVLTRTIDGQPVAWIGASDPRAIPGLARKLPHYGKYGYLVFKGTAPDNVLKGQWPPGDSALTRRIDGSGRDSSTPDRGLAELANRPPQPPSGPDPRR